MGEKGNRFHSLQEWRVTTTASILVQGFTNPMDMAKPLPGIKRPDREADHSVTYKANYNLRKKLQKCIHSIYFNRKCLQYGITPRYANIKFQKCIQSIYFNRKCLQYGITPRYANIKIPNSSPAAKRSQRKSSTIRIKDEIKFLYCKKKHLNQKLYTLHLCLANIWGQSMPTHTKHHRYGNHILWHTRLQKKLDTKIQNSLTKQNTLPDTKVKFSPKNNILL